MRFLIFILFTALVFCGCGSNTGTRTDSGVADVASPISEVSPVEAEAAVSKAYAQFVDVRTPEEYAAGHAARAVNIPLDILGANLDRLEKSEPVYLICKTGNRSAKAAAELKAAGFNNVISVAGGTDAWLAGDLPMSNLPPHHPPAK